MKANEKTLSSKQEKLDELHAQQAKLRELQSELDTVIKTSPVGFWICGPNGKFNEVNDGRI